MPTSAKAEVQHMRLPQEVNDGAASRHGCAIVFEVAA